MYRILEDAHRGGGGSSFDETFAHMVRLRGFDEPDWTLQDQELNYPGVRFSSSRDPEYEDKRRGPPKSFLGKFFGVALILFASIGLLMGWAFSTMVDPELQGLDWWVEVTSKQDFLSGNILLLGILLGALHMLTRSPDS